MQTFLSSFVCSLPLLVLSGCALESASDAPSDTALASHEDPQGPEPGSVRVDSFGTTCVRGLWTVSAVETDGSSTFTLSTLSSYTSILEPEADRAPFDCALQLRLGIRPGEQWAFSGAALQGAANLAESGRGTVEVRYTNSGAEGVTRPFLSSESRSTSVAIHGPYTGGLALALEVPAAAAAWSGCGLERDERLSIYTALTQGYPRGRGSLTLAVDGRTTFTLRYAIRKCGSDGGAEP